MMNRVTVLEKLQGIFCDIFDDDNIVLKENMDGNDIEGWDSLTNINILAAVQDEFGVSFNMDEVVKIKNVEDIVSGIIKKSGE